LDKAEKHAMSQRLEPDEMEGIDGSDFAGLTQEDIDEERQEYVHIMIWSQ
jgi:hypothetical protein